MYNEKHDSLMEFLKAHDIDYSKVMNMEMDMPFGDPIDIEDEDEDDGDRDHFLNRLKKYEIARCYEGEGIMSIDHAKYFIHNNFDLNRQVPDMRGSNTIYKGNIYESEAPDSLKNFILDFDCKYKGISDDFEAIKVEVDGKDFTVMPIDTTVYSDSITNSIGSIRIGDELYVIAINADLENVLVAVSIIRKTEKKYFENITSVYGRASAIKAYHRLFKGKNKKKDFIKAQQKSQKYARYNSALNIAFDKRAEQQLFYAMNKDTYPIETQCQIEALFDDPDILRHSVNQRLSCILKLSPTCKDRRPLNKELLKETLEKYLYKMEKVQNLLYEGLLANERAGKRGLKILLVGSTNTGEMSIAELIAEVLNIPCGTIPLGGCSSGLELEGSDAGYDKSGPGRFVKVCSPRGTTEMVVKLTGLDGVNPKSNEGNPYLVLENTLAGMHEDKFLGCPISTENTIFVATANTLNNIPPYILDKFDMIIDVDDHTVEETVEIAKRELIPEILINYKIAPNDLAFTDEAVYVIASEYSAEGDVRGIKKNLEFVVKRMIREEKIVNHTVGADDVKAILDPISKEDDGVYANQHRNEYSEPVAKEIKRILNEIKSVGNSDFNGDNVRIDKDKRVLKYLLACTNEETCFTDTFDADAFRSSLHKKLYGMDSVIDELTYSFYLATLQKDMSHTNIALFGGMGTGKTTIAEAVAKAIGYSFVRVPLNGINDLSDIRGFESTYSGSKAGLIMDAIQKAGTLNVVILLDEGDKASTQVAEALIDLLDRSFTDNFLGVPVELRNVIFILTANDWSKVPPVIRNRFNAIEVEGYTREEKTHILDEYIIPRIEESISGTDVSITMTDEAKEYLLKTYCPSFGVRDLDKAIQKITACKLMELPNDNYAKWVRICKGDIDQYMDIKPIPRGNLPLSEEKPGVSRALAVSAGIYSNSFAIETVLVDGAGAIEITGLPRESAIDSVKIAVTCIKKRYPSLLKGKDIHVHFGEGSVPKDGPSAGVAIYMSIYSAAIDKPVKYKKPYDIAFTGEISLTGGVFAVGGVYEKLQAACDAGCSKVFVPLQNYERLEKSRLSEFRTKIIPVSDIDQVVKEVYGDEQ